MNRRILAGILTVAVLGLVVGLGARRQPAVGPGLAPTGAAGPSDTPEACLRKLIDDARAGDVDGYLGAFAEPLRSRLGREADEAGLAAFGDSLKRASEARKGYALYAPEADGPDAVRIAVESVYPDRNERQVYRLERGADGWRIGQVESMRGRTPAERFGTPATYKEPEGVPVQGVEPAESLSQKREGEAPSEPSPAARTEPRPPENPASGTASESSETDHP